MQSLEAANWVIALLLALGGAEGFRHVKIVKSYRSELAEVRGVVERFQTEVLKKGADEKER